MFNLARPKAGFALPMKLLVAGLALLIHPLPGRCADGDSTRKLIDQVRPQYPELAKQMRVSGLIILKISILPNGRVSDVQLEKGHPLLLRAAEEAVRHWRFAVAPETTMQDVQVHFSLPQ